MKIKKFADIFIDRFVDCNTMTWAASVAFYTALSLAPLLIIFLAIVASMGVELQVEFLQEAQNLLGPLAAQAIEGIIANAQDRVDLLSWAGFFGGATLMLSGSLIFGELRAALSVILGIEKEVEEVGVFKAVLKYLKSRILQMGLAFAFLFVMVVSLMISTIISSYFRIESLPFETLTMLLNIGVSLLVYVMIFTNLFHFLPMPHLPWKTSLCAGFFTSILFVIGKELVGLYLGNSVLGSAYGAAGSIVVLLAWVYYTAVIIFTGAHLAYVLREVFEESKSLDPSSFGS